MMGISVGDRSMAQWLGSAFAATGPDRGRRAASGLSSGGEFRGTIKPPSRRAAEPPSRRAAEPPSRRAALSAPARHGGFRESATGPVQRRLTLPGLTFAVMVLALAGTVPDAHAQQNEVYFATDTIHVIPGQDLQVTPTLRYAESTNVAVHIRTVTPTGNLNRYQPARFGYGHNSGRDFTPVLDRRGHSISPGSDQFEILAPIITLTGATPPAQGNIGKYFYVEITKVTTDGERDSSNIHPKVTIGTPHRVTVFIDYAHQTRSMPQILLSKNNLRVAEPAHDSCSDSHVGDEKTFTDITLGDGAAGVRTVRNYGPVLTSVKYKVQLDRKPGPGKVVSVEIWEPTDLDRPDVGRFHENARIHGIGWPAIRQGRISIDNSPVLNQGQPVGDGSRRHLNTYLTFDDSNWKRAQTVTVNIHCAQHDVTTPLPIWHFAFRHNKPGWGYPSYMYNRKGDNSRANTSLKIAQVRVADRTEPPKITGNPRGNLVLDPDVSGHFVLSDDGEDGYAHIIGLDFRWNNPDNSHHNDYDDANEKFAGFRVRFRTVDPSGHAVQEKFVRADFIIPGDAPTTASWRAALEANGYDHAKRFAPNRPDRKYEWSVVPVDRHWNNVEAERVTRCVLMTGNTLDLTATPDCPPAPQNAPAQAAPAPTETVSNLQLTAVDDASASVTWDAVAHATSYEVSWDGSGSQTAVSGTVRVTGTSATIQHNAQEAMTLTVTVTPEHLDDNGVVQRLDALAATATLAVGAAGDALSASAQGADSQAPACVSDALLAEVRTAAGETWRSPGHVERWSRVLAAFGVNNAYSSNPMTVAEARAQADRGLQRWKPVAPALECLAAAPEEQPEQAEVQPVTPATPELSLSAGSAVDEGGNATFTVTADPAPQSDLTIAWTVAQSGEYLDAPGAGSRTVTLTAGTTSTDLSVATVDDAADEADGSVSVTLGAGTGYTIATGKGSAAVAVRDNDEPVVSIAAGNGVTEGTAASFTVSASPVPAAPLDVTLTVGQSGDFAASGETGSRTVTVPVTGSMTFEVATVDDGADEPDGSIAATLGTGTGYTVAAAPDNAATVAVSDNDAAASGPTISIADATMKENQRNGYFKVTLSEKVAWPVHVYYATRDSTPVSAVAGQDYLAWQRSWRLRARFRPGETETQIHVPLYNDSHDEDPETFEMVLFDAGVNGPPGVSVSIADGVAVGTITNSDPMPAAWLARFGRTAAEQALDGIAGRIAAPRSAGVQGTIAGQALNLDPGSRSGAANDNADPTSLAGKDVPARSHSARAFGASADGRGGGGIGDDAHGFATGPVSGAGGAGSYTMTGLEALLGSSFTATGEKDGMGGSLAFWGRAAQSSFDGREGTFSLDGEATTAMLGADYARGKWLVGMALMRSSGEGGYADNGTGPRHCPDVGEGMDPAAMAHLCGGAVREGDGKVEASLMAAVPYAAIQASEHLKLWGAAGHGTGEVTLKPEVGGSLSSDIAWTMAAAGVRNDLVSLSREGSGLALALTSDALWARTSSEKTHELAASESDVTRLRLGLEGSWRIATEGGGSLTPKLEIGARHDGGDAETGFGVELGGGLAWVDPTLGLSLDLSGRTLVAHGSDDLEDRGFAASLAFDPDPATARGPSLTLTQDWGGAAQGGLDALFASDPLADRAGGGEATARWTAEAAWGFPAFSGRFTGSPHVGLGLATDARDYSLGWRLTPAANANAPDISFGVKGMRRESGWAEPEHTLGLETTLRW